MASPSASFILFTNAAWYLLLAQPSATKAPTARDDRLIWSAKEYLSLGKFIVPKKIFFASVSAN